MSSTLAQAHAAALSEPRPTAPTPDVEALVRSASAPLATAASALPALVEEDYSRPVRPREVLAVLARFSLVTGWTATPERRAALALSITEAGYTRAEVELAGKALEHDEPLTRALRFPEGTVTPADFRRVLDAGHGPAGKARLYTYAEARDRFNALYFVEGGADAGRAGMQDFFQPVPVPGRSLPMWREK